MSDLPPEHLIGPSIHQVTLIDPVTRTKFTFQIVGYHDFPAPVQRRMGFLHDIMIEPMSEAEIAEYFGLQIDAPAVKGDGALGDPLTPEQADKVRRDINEAALREVERAKDEEEAEAAAAKSLIKIREELVKAQEEKEDK